ncbi:hypothetical protein DEU56DRAFT_927406 [Suillus clintonianus]|uniref:uncharacterized protein n=1 Tax=Suillus clintonianus TaxID=1904413 RepID=UPI001B8613A5|nr:uncharacterized protein DEU56DRAFT_927406 [Suillus clintonianus]KAG2121480.1 hypothetical protein DEU56DRAFT_927406 [Suillus clintonianus]
MADQPSVASLVYSVYGYAARYEEMVLVQHPRQEKMTSCAAGLRSLFHLLRARDINYHERAIDEVGEYKRAAPVRFMFFRDGLSEGEYSIVGQEEIGTSQHHARFVPKNRNEWDKSGKCPVGFVADQGICNPAIHNFYLQSHPADRAIRSH